MGTDWKLWHNYCEYSLKSQGPVPELTSPAVGVIVELRSSWRARIFARLMAMGLLFGLPLVAASPATARTYFIAPNGNNSDLGTESSPWKTIQHCADVAQAGDSCLVQAGTYSERVAPANGGTPDNLITFTAQGTVVMQGFTLQTGYIRVQGFEITNAPNRFPDYYGVYLQGDGYEVIDNYVHDLVRDGIYVARSSPFANNSLIRGNIIRFVYGTGITLFGQGNIAEANDISHILISFDDADGMRFFGDGHIIRYNYIHDITEAEAPGAHTDCFQTFDNSHPQSTNILVEGNYCYNLDHQMLMISAVSKGQSTNVTIRNNIFEAGKSPAAGWQMIYVLDIPNVTIVHNTFVNARYRGIIFEGKSQGGIVRNNIFFNVPQAYEGSGFVASNNLFYPNASVDESNAIVANPEFVDFARHDFHLRNSSPAVDGGADVGVTTDRDGNARPQGSAPDIGAYEFGGSLPADATPPTVSVTAPADSAVVTGPSVLVSANASDNVGVVGVQFRLDGVNLGTEDTASPYSVIWDTTMATEGTHTLTAVARDAAGNSTTSSSVTVTVPDTTPPETPTGLRVQ